MRNISNCIVYIKISKESGNDYFRIGKDESEVCDRKFHKEDFEHYDYYTAVLTNIGFIYMSKLTDKGWCDCGIFPNYENTIINIDNDLTSDDEFEKYIAESIENDICNDPEFEKAANRIFSTNVKEQNQ